MSLVRTVTFFAATALLGGGHLASQAAFLKSLDHASAGATAEYAARIDSASVSLLALAILVVCVLSAFVGSKPEDAP